MTRSLDQLCPHPSYVLHKLSVPAAKLSALAALGDLAFQYPLAITQNGMIIDGYGRLELAKHQGRQTVLCIQYELSEQDALRWLLQSQRPSGGLNSYCRVLLALDLEASLQEKARANQQAGGHHKGLSNLTEARRLDVRSEVAAVAGVSTGNVTKIKDMRKSVHFRVEYAVRAGEISIHKAWQWRKLSAQQQLRALEEYLSRKGTSKTSRRLIKKHLAKLSPKELIHPRLSDLLKPIAQWGILDSIVVSEIDSPGRIAYLTQDALRTLKSPEVGKCTIDTC